MKTNAREKLLVYVAYTLGRKSVTRGNSAQDASLAQTCLRALEGESQTETTLRRRLFYSLVLAELNRHTNPLSFRQSANKLGKELAEKNEPNPFPLYMRVIEATTQPPTTGNFGDGKTEASEPIRMTEPTTAPSGDVVFVDSARLALGLSERELAKHDRVVQSSLREIADKHRLV